MAKKRRYLPNKPSKLIRLALEDLDAVEANPLYTVEMTRQWHEQVGKQMCAVCFAGSVMTNSLGARRNSEKTPENFSESQTRKLHALNYFRKGDVRGGLKKMLIDHFPGDSTANFAATDYSEDPVRFKKEMEQLSYRLEAVGL